jgi:hypothetical protein
MPIPAYGFGWAEVWLIDDDLVEQRIRRLSTDISS